MNEIGESLAELGQGTITAAAVEPNASTSALQATGSDGHTHESGCLNCGTALVGSHCHACGQAAHVHRTLSAFFHDLLHGVFHFEGKIWRTLPLLAWQPGRLTREYVDGRRASYVSPIALFLFSVFLMFAVFHATQGPETVSTSPTSTSPVSTGDLNDGLARLESDVARLEKDIATAREKGRPADALEANLERRRDALSIVRGIESDGGPASAGGQRRFSDIPQLDKAVRKFKSNPELASYKLQTYAYKYSWALIPISVPFLWLLFPFSRRFRLYDHTVFVTYSLCFMTLLAIVGMLLSAAGAAGIATVLAVLPPVHMYRQLRGTYSVGRIGAAVRSVLLLWFALTALILFFILIMAQTSL